MKLTIYGQFMDLNQYINKERGNKFAGSTEKKRNTEDAMKQITGNHKIEKPCHITFKWITTNERIDPDNICFAKKFLLDAFVKKGLLKNDSRKFITSFTDLFGTDSNNPRVEIEISEV